MKKFALLLAVALMATLIAGCGGKVPIKVTNDLGAWNIHEIYISPSSEPGWGNNLITDILEPGDEFTSMVTADNYDIKLFDEDGDEYVMYLVEVGADGFNWNVELEDMI